MSLLLHPDPSSPLFQFELRLIKADLQPEQRHLYWAVLGVRVTFKKLWNLSASFLSSSCPLVSKMRRTSSYSQSNSHTYIEYPFIWC